MLFWNAGRQADQIKKLIRNNVMHSVSKHVIGYAISPKLFTKFICVMMTYANWCKGDSIFPGNTRLAKEIGCSQASVKRLLKVAVALGILECVRVGGRQPGVKAWASEYRFPLRLGENASLKPTPPKPRRTSRALSKAQRLRNRAAAEIINVIEHVGRKHPHIHMSPENKWTAAHKLAANERFNTLRHSMTPEQLAKTIISGDEIIKRRNTGIRSISKTLLSALESGTRKPCVA